MKLLPKASCPGCICVPSWYVIWYFPCIIVFELNFESCSVSYVLCQFPQRLMLYTSPLVKSAIALTINMWNNKFLSDVTPEPGTGSGYNLMLSAEFLGMRAVWNETEWNPGLRTQVSVSESPWCVFAVACVIGISVAQSRYEPAAFSPRAIVLPRRSGRWSAM